jgi:predicted aldo/keto reductase-like oxidoreductase
VFPELPEGAARPAMVAYTATRWGSLLDPKKTPAREKTPAAEHCYSFCLSHPAVDMTLCGPATTEHVREAITALSKGPLDEEELAWMRRVGDHVYGRTPIRKMMD